MAVETTAQARSDAAHTIGELWRRAGARKSDSSAYLVKEGREWREVGWAEASERVDELAAGFLALGIVKGDRVAILSRTRLEWTLCDFALASIGAVVVPIYQTSSAEECAYVLADSGARAFICEDLEQLEKARGLGAAGPELTISIEDTGRGVPLAAVVERGRAYHAERPDALAAARGSVSPSDVLTLIYTSGTTGNPKGCVQSHSNWWALLESIGKVEGLMAPGDVALLFLPLAHNFARLVQFAGAATGFTIAFVPEPNRVGRALMEVRPTIFPSVPRLYERVYRSVWGRLRQEEGFRRFLANRALATGRRAARRRASGRRIGPLLALQLQLADWILFARIKSRFGGRLRHAVSGGAPLAAEIAEFFAACGVVILEGYGLTETTSACAVNRPGDYRFGTVGSALPGVELALAEDGEIKVRGETLFQGYHGNPEATAEIMAEGGWLLTGDIGTIDEGGFVTITDRKKELIVTSGGKKISPGNLENALEASAYVSTALVVGDNRSYLTALIYPDLEEIRRAAKGEEGVSTLIQGVVDEVNSHHGDVEQIRRFALLPRDFSADEGEITPTLKIRRKICEDHFRDEIERLYGPDRAA
ncbi:MAG: long-chain fatty acid--CoA ligase [Gaiellaceae bacterium]